MRIHAWPIAAAIGLLAVDCRLDLADQNKDDSQPRPVAARDGGTTDTDTDTKTESDGATTREDAARASMDSAARSGMTSAKDDRAQGSAASKQSCAGLDAARASTLPAAKGGMTLVSGLVRVTGKGTLNGNITIEPGTTFLMDADSVLNLGDPYGGRATLTARGTADKPIRVCGAQARPGFFGFVAFNSGLTSDSVIEHWVISDGGGNDGASTVLATAVLVKDLAIQGSGSDGLSAADFGEGGSGLEVTGSARDAVLLTTPSAADHFPADSLIADNEGDVVKLTYSQIKGRCTLRDLGVPYLQVNNLSIQDGAVLAIEAGVEYQLNADTGLDVGPYGTSGELQVMGEADKEVLFRGQKASPGSWTGIVIENSASRDTKLSHLRIQHAGGKDHASLSVGSAITLDHVEISDAKHGLNLGAALSADSEVLSVTAVDDYPVIVATGALASLPAGGSFTGNAKDMISVSGSQNLVGTIANLGVPYYVQSDLSFGGDSDITLAPGVELVFASAHKYVFQVGKYGQSAKLTAAGTASQPIVMRGEKDEPGSWNGLLFDGSASLDSRIDHLELTNAGLVLRVPIPVTNSHFARSATYGITKAGSNAMDYTATNTFEDNALGEVGEL